MISAAWNPPCHPQIHRVQDWPPHLIQLLVNHYFHYLFCIIAFANPQLHLHFLSAHHPLPPLLGASLEVPTCSWCPL